MNAPGPELAGPLDALLSPGPEQATFLRACLGEGPANEVGSLPAAVRDHGDPALLPLLARASGRQADRETGALLRAAVAHERARGEVFAEAVAEVGSAFERARVEAVLLPGAALAESLYGGWGLRHCHDLDLLVPREGLERARQAIGGGRKLENGVFVSLHTRLIRGVVAGLPYDAARHRSVPLSAAADGRAGGTDGALLALERPAAIAYVAGQSRWSRRRSLVWAADLAALAGWGGFGAGPPDWEAVAEACDQARVSLLAWLRLRWMRERVGSPIPEPALARLGAGAAADRRQGDELLASLARTPGRPMAMLRSAGGPAGAVKLASRMAVPGHEHLGTEPRSRLPAAARRLAAYGGEVVRGRATGLRNRLRRLIGRARTFVP